MKYTALEIEFEGEKNCGECIMHRPSPEGWTCYLQKGKRNKTNAEFIKGCKLKPISVLEPTHSDILTAIAALREDIRRLQQGERIGL